MTKDRWVTGVVSPDFPHARLVGDFHEDPGVTHGLKDLFQGHNVTQQRSNFSKKNWLVSLRNKGYITQLY